jgi:hypothetical protein
MRWRGVNSPEAFKKIVEFLKQDVVANGGSATEIINMHGQLVHLMVCEHRGLNSKLEIVPWGTIVFHKEITEFEAWAWWIQDVE